MTSRRRVITAFSVFAAAFLMAGCTASPGSSAPTSTPSSNSPDGGAIDDDYDDMEGALLDDGRMFAVITWGSSTCVPQVDTVTANGQTVSVKLVDVDEDAVCTADMAQRASLGAVPAGIDPTKEITLQVAYGEASDDVEIGGGTVTGVPGESTEYMPSAAWFEDGSLVLLTWGSSGCPPIVESLEGSGNAGTATFVTDDDKACTMDMAPRATILAFGEDTVDDDAFTLTLVGGGLDGTVSVLAD